MPKGKDVLLLTLAMVGVGTSGPLVAKSTVPVPGVVFWRNIFGSLLLTPLAIRSGDWKSPAKRKLMRRSAFAGFLLAIHFTFFFLAMRFTTVAAGTALAALQPVFAALYFRFKGDHISRQSMIGILIGLASVFVITGFDFALSTRAFIGDIFGITCAILAMAYMNIGSKVQRELSTWSHTAVCYGACAATSFPMLFIFKMELYNYGLMNWIYIGGLILGAQIMGHTFFNIVLKRVSPVVVSLVVFFEVPLAAFIAWIWNHQNPGAGVYAGTLGILIGSSIFILGGKK